MFFKDSLEKNWMCANNSSGGIFGQMVLASQLRKLIQLNNKNGQFDIRSDFHSLKLAENTLH